MIDDHICEMNTFAQALDQQKRLAVFGHYRREAVKHHSGLNLSPAQREGLKDLFGQGLQLKHVAYLTNLNELTISGIYKRYKAGEL
jgi:hypothetical protein